jgi:MFS superfamily sulfate permease-like transporter
VATQAHLFRYPIAWLPGDAMAGITLAAYAIPVSLAYAALAGLPPQVGVYGYLLGGLDTRWPGLRVISQSARRQRFR